MSRVSGRGLPLREPWRPASVVASAGVGFYFWQLGSIWLQPKPPNSSRDPGGERDLPGSAAGWHRKPIMKDAVDRQRFAETMAETDARAVDFRADSSRRPMPRGPRPPPGAAKRTPAVGSRPRATRIARPTRTLSTVRSSAFSRPSARVPNFSAPLASFQGRAWRAPKDQRSRTRLKRRGWEKTSSSRSNCPSITGTELSTGSKMGTVRSRSCPPRPRSPAGGTHRTDAGRALVPFRELRPDEFRLQISSVSTTGADLY